MNTDEELIREALRAAGRLPGMDAARPQPAESAAYETPPAGPRTPPGDADDLMREIELSQAARLKALLRSGWQA